MEVVKVIIIMLMVINTASDGSDKKITLNLARIICR
jgi:hypothetical protein